MALKFECDSCGALARPGGMDEAPDGWVLVTIAPTSVKEWALCPVCAAIPMRFGNVTYEYTAPARPRAMIPNRR